LLSLLVSTEDKRLEAIFRALDEFTTNRVEQAQTLRIALRWAEASNPEFFTDMGNDPAFAALQIASSESAP
jgi:hypothetical protein